MSQISQSAQQRQLQQQRARAKIDARNKARLAKQGMQARKGRATPRPSSPRVRPMTPLAFKDLRTLTPDAAFYGPPPPQRPQPPRQRPMPPPQEEYDEEYYEAEDEAQAMAERMLFPETEEEAFEDFAMVVGLGEQGDPFWKRVGRLVAQGFRSLESIYKSGASAKRIAAISNKVSGIVSGWGLDSPVNLVGLDTSQMMMLAEKLSGQKMMGNDLCGYDDPYLMGKFNFFDITKGIASVAKAVGPVVSQIYPPAGMALNAAGGLLDLANKGDPRAKAKIQKAQTDAKAGIPAAQKAVGMLKVAKAVDQNVKATAILHRAQAGDPAARNKIQTLKAAGLSDPRAAEAYSAIEAAKKGEGLKDRMNDPSMKFPQGGARPGQEVITRGRVLEVLSGVEIF